MGLAMVDEAAEHLFGGIELYEHPVLLPHLLGFFELFEHLRLDMGLTIVDVAAEHLFGGVEEYLRSSSFFDPFGTIENLALSSAVHTEPWTSSSATSATCAPPGARPVVGLTSLDPVVVP